MQTASRFESSNPEYAYFAFLHMLLSARDRELLISIALAQIRCRPDRVGSLTDALVRRPDIAYANLASGGSEITCVIRAPVDLADENILLGKPNNSSSVLDIRIDLLIHSSPPSVSLAGPATARTSTTNTSACSVMTSQREPTRTPGCRARTTVHRSTHWHRTAAPPTPASQS